MKPKLPAIKDLSELVRWVKPQICDDYVDEDDTLPSICLTVGADTATGEWAFQTGDNSYTGGAYRFRDWAVVIVYRRSNSIELARDIRSQLSDLFYS